MSRKLDNKILELLKDEVLEKNQEIEREIAHEQEYQSTSEALAELTSLSKTDVDKLYQKIRTEAYQQQKKRNIIIISIILVLLVIGAIFVYKYLNPPVPPRVFTETFDNVDNGWDIYDQFSIKSSIQNGVYDFNCYTKTGYTRQDGVTINLPANYNVEVATTLVESETTDSYGLHLENAKGDFGYFFIRKDGKYRYGFKENNEWITNNPWEVCSTYQPLNKVNTLKIEVRGNKFQFFVNNTLMVSSDMEQITMNKVAILVGGTQHVLFDYLHVTVPNKKGFLYQDEFDIPQKEWSPSTVLVKQSELKDGKYYFTTNKSDYCYWTDILLPEYEEFEVKATLGYHGGIEKDDFGIMLLEDAKNYFAFEISASGKARMVIRENSEFTYTGEYKKIKNKTDAKKSVTMRIKVTKKTIEYYLENVLIDKCRRTKYSVLLKEIGLRICGKQTVYFDNLQITEVKK